MKLSTRATYTARAMLDLALHFNEGPILIRDISKRQQISERYLEQLFIPLRLARLVTSIRGAHGGFSLSKVPSDIRFSEIVKVTEGSIVPVDCSDDPLICEGSIDECVICDVWSEVKKAMDRVFDSITLQDLVDMQKEKSGLTRQRDRDNVLHTSILD
ncbi:MAG TPA: Rrf2 family transcriptional regulator [Dehalococcoidia bacterium]|nr:Rrf2 family transcriptional regulator [Dehalococcoidia bacterium]